jgi:hypothetical protein
MISRLSGRPGQSGPPPLKESEAADIIRRFFHVLSRLQHLPAPETKARKRPGRGRKPPEAA